MIFSIIWFVFTVFGSGALVAGLLFLWTGGQLGEVSEKLTPQQAELHLAELEKQRQQEEDAREQKQHEAQLDRLQQQNEALQEETLWGSNPRSSSTDARTSELLRKAALWDQ